MNPETAREDVLALEPGARRRLRRAAEARRAAHRRRRSIPVPFDKIVADVCTDAKLRQLVLNMIYDGVLAELLGDRARRDGEGARASSSGKKPKALELNIGALDAGYDVRAGEPAEERPVPRRADERDGRARS